MPCQRTLCRDRDASATSSHDLSRCVRRCREHSSSTPVGVGRYYDPTTGQFLCVDPDVRDSGVGYAYADDNPVSDSDPTGQA
ncbi:MAG: RHS repeat-associated core domain-containing protein, partial [Acidimicrobiales bacterium]